MPAPTIEMLPLDALIRYAANARTHSKKQLRMLARAIQQFGFTNPVLINDQNEILAGHGRVEAARSLGMTHVPTLRLAHLTPEQCRAYVLADNQLALKAGWDTEMLAIELQGVIDLGFEVELTGFEVAEADMIILGEAEKASDPREDLIPEPAATPPVTSPGDVWELGRHRLICGDARDPTVYAALLGRERVDLGFHDFPYNVKIQGHVSGLGRIVHDEFAFASGEMAEHEFIAFLFASLQVMKAHSRDGALHYGCMDDAHAFELLTAARQAGLCHKATCVWAKTNGGMGSLYRKQCEFVHVFKVGTGVHVNNVELGRHGRNRTTLWSYAGVNTFRSGRMDELAMHPTVKPVQLVADAILDGSKRRDLVLDAFLGSGTTLIAAEKTGRRGRGIEYEPRYCDVGVRRWQAHTGKQARLVATGQSYEEVEEQRQAANDDTPVEQTSSLSDQGGQAA